MSDASRPLDSDDASDRPVAADLFPLVYDELRRLAAARMAAERPDHTLDPTGLVYEAYVRLRGDRQFEDVLEQVVGRFEDEYPRHPQLVLRDLVVTDAELLNLSGRTSEEAIAEMAALIPAAYVPVGADIGALAIERERELPTNLGLGVAIPHARCPHLANPLVVFGRSADGVAFGPQSADLVHLIFLLVTPAEQPNLHLHLLGQVARVAGDPERRRRLRAAASPSEIGEVLAVADPVDSARPSGTV